MEDILAQLRRASVSTLGHLTDFGYAHGVQALRRPSHAVGLAFTVRIPHLDGTALHYAMDYVQPGDVIVIDTVGERMRACWGGVSAYAATQAGAEAVIVDGLVTDWLELMDGGPSVWCRGLSALTTRAPRFEGALLVPVQIGGAVVNPGDIVFADSDGVFFIQAKRAQHVAEAIVAREALDVAMKQRLEAGARLGDVSGARKYIESSR